VGRDLVVFSNDWDGDPLSKTHIMRILSRENRVLWVNSLGNRKPQPNAHDARRVLRKWRDFREGLRQVEPNLYVLAPLAVPAFGPRAQRVNAHAVRAQVRRAMAKLGFEDVISWSFLPSSAPVSGSLGESLVVYHCVDEFSAFSDTDARQISSLEERLLRRADLVISSSERLLERKRLSNPHAVLVRHGVDFAHFSRALDADTRVPADVAGLPRPVLGFFGLVADWVDLSVFEALARRFPEGSVVVLGKISPDVDVSRLHGLPNVHLLGRKPYSSLPGYCRAFDVGLLPFVQNELTLNANPLKVREYLAAGLPVVATDLPETRGLGNGCFLARSREEFLRQAEAALGQGGGVSAERSELLRRESWEARVEEIRTAVGERMISLRGAATPPTPRPAVTGATTRRG
jgi:glycosyltransferase involved in cell wall biosynthesis